jgi:hypothetical protein
MNLDELCASLPNGLHDAELLAFEVDYSRHTLTCRLNVWVGDMNDASRREAYRPARVVFERIAYVVVEPPDERSPWLDGTPLTIDAGIGDPVDSPVIPPQPVGYFRGYFFLGALNAFMRFGAEDATLEWLGEESSR